MATTIQLRLPELHASQKEVLRESKRFNVLKNGRRWGKTKLAVTLAIETMLEGHPVGYWCPTYKDLFEVWREMKQTLKDVTTFKSEQVNQIEMYGGGKIDFWSMQDPDSGRGRKYKRAIVDEAEKAMYFKDCFDLTIRPTLVDLEGDAWILSTPKGTHTYFSELFKRKEKFDNWMSWQKGTIENPYIPKSEIEEARQQLDSFTFKQEFEGVSIDHAAHPWAHAFDESKHTGRVDNHPRHDIYISFDFNASPCTCTVWQHFDNKIRCLYELFSNVGLGDLCRQIVDLIGTDENGELLQQVFVTGDRSGYNKSELLEGNRTAYDIIKKELNLSKYAVQTPSVNPNLLKSRELVNSIFEKHPHVIISNVHCKNLIFDLKFVEVSPDLSIKKDRTKQEGKADFLDCLRYYISSYHQDFVRLNV